ncbi:MAG: hypothetical protein KAS07_01185 [Candidatus Pacebacteria bacterium]|nr:hypothetical protein [Candidatus Paceibacterota bacterium]
MEQEIITRLESLEIKIDTMQETMNSLRWYFKISAILTILFFVLSLIVAVIAIPFIINTYSSMYEGLL